MKANLKEGDLVAIHVHVGPRAVYTGLTGKIIRVYEKMFFGYRVYVDGYGVEGFTRDELTRVETSSGDEPG